MAGRRLLFVAASAVVAQQAAVDAAAPVASPPCANGPAMYSTTVKGQRMCLTSPSGYDLTFAPCATTTNQLFSGINTNRVVVESTANWCITMNGWSITAGSMPLMYTCSGSPAQNFNLLTTGQIEVGASGLCVSSTGTNQQYQSILVPCDPTGTVTTQIFSPICPPSPPPPEAILPASCGGGPTMYSQVAANGQQLCVTNPAGSNLGMAQCASATNQLFSGINTDRVVIESTANWCWTMNSWSLTAGNPLVMWTCSNSPAQLFSLNAAGQLEAGGSATGLCVSYSGSNQNNPLVLETCDDTIPTQIFQPVCPPAPPPPVAIAAPPCNGGPTMMTQNVKGTTMCWTNNGGDGLAFAPCTTATSQLWDGWNTDRVTVSNIGDCLTMNNWQLTAGNFVLSWTCANSPAQLFTLNADGQIEAGGPSTGLCVSSTGSPNPSFPFVLETCDTTVASQIFAPQCPPAPPPPVALVSPPCGGAPTMMAQNVKGTQQCMTNSAGFALGWAPCATAPSQLWGGWNTEHVSAPSNGYCLTMSSWQLTEGNFIVAYTCANNPAQLFDINAMGQIEAGGPSTGLCVSSTGSPNPSYQFALAQCDDTDPTQIFTAQCPPAPPPPVATVAPPCGGGAAQYAVTLASGKQQCLQIVEGQYVLTTGACVLGPTQLWSGMSKATGLTDAYNGWCVTMEGYSEVAGNTAVQYPCGAGASGAEVFNFNADGQIVAGATTLCLTVSPSNTIVLEECDSTQASQTWSPICPPGPPPPVQFAQPPCGGGPVALAAPTASGAEACLTGGASGYSLGLLQCTNSPSQLISGFGSANGVVFSANDWCLTTGYFEATIGDLVVWWPCRYGGAPQVWELNAANQLVLAESPATAQLCVQHNPATNNMNLQPCNTEEPLQIWTPMCPPSPPPPTPSPSPPLPPVPTMPAACGGAPAMYYVSGPYGSLCMTAAVATPQYSAITAAPCTGAASQLFTGLDTRGGVIQQSSDWCITMYGYRATQGNILEMWPCGQAGTPEFVWDDTNHITLNNLCVTFTGPNADFTLEPCTSGYQQSFQAMCQSPPPSPLPPSHPTVKLSPPPSPTPPTPPPPPPSPTPPPPGPMPCGPEVPSMYAIAASAADDLCLTTTGPNAAGPSAAQVGPCSGSIDQMWSFAGELFQQSGSDLCLQAAGGTAVAGAPVVTGPCDPVSGGLEVTWLNGQLEILGLCVTASPAVGTVTLQECAQAPAQTFQSICTVSPPPPLAPAPVPAPAQDISSVPVAPLPAPAPAPAPTPAQAALTPATDANGKAWHPKYQINRCGKNKPAMFVTTTTQGRLCLDTTSAESASGVVLNGCNEGPSQQWLWDSGLSLQQNSSGLCLNGASNQNGAAVTTDACGLGSPLPSNVIWQLDSQGQLVGMGSCAWYTGSTLSEGTPVVLHQCEQDYELTFTVACPEFAPQWWAAEDARFTQLNAKAAALKEAAEAPTGSNELLGQGMEASALSSDQQQLSQAVASDKTAQQALQEQLQASGATQSEVTASEEKLTDQQEAALKALIAQQEQAQGAMEAKLTKTEQAAGLLAPAPAPSQSTDWHTASSKQFLGDLGSNKGILTHQRQQEAAAVQASVTQEVDTLTAAQNDALDAFVAEQTKEEDATSRRRSRRAFA